MHATIRDTDEMTAEERRAYLALARAAQRVQEIEARRKSQRQSRRQPQTTEAAR
jgi:hypothetical protein